MLLAHVIDGTYELFRHFFALPSHEAKGREVGAVRGVLASLVGLLEDGATHVGVATDHVIESFRNDLWPTYKTGEGVDPQIKAQFGLLEDVLRSAGFLVWAMVEHEADDALAAAAVALAADPRVDQVRICTPDKDLAQCVTEDGRIVQFDRRKGAVLDADGVRSKYGVDPPSIPDYLALVGDSADGFPGLPGWGAKSAAAVLARWKRIDAIPPSSEDWGADIRGAAKLAVTLRAHLGDALLFRRLATLETDAVTPTLEDLEWVRPCDDAASVLGAIDASGAHTRLVRLARARQK